MIDDQFLGPRVSVVAGRADVYLFMAATKTQKCIENVTQKYIRDIPGAYLQYTYIAYLCNIRLNPFNRNNQLYSSFINV